MKSPKTNISTLSHEFQVPLPYKIDGKQVKWGSEVLGGEFLGHHGHWQADSTRGSIVPEQKDHPILIGVDDIWGKSDVCRTYKEGTSLPAECTALVWGQPLLGRNHDDAPNPKLEPLPVAWFKNWQTRVANGLSVLTNAMIWVAR